MIINIDEKKFMNMLRETRQEDNDLVRRYSEEIVMIPELFEVHVKIAIDDVVESIGMERLSRLNVEGRKALFGMSQAFVLKPTDRGIAFNISSYTEGRLQKSVSELILGYDGEIHFDDKGAVEKAERYGFTDISQDDLFAHTINVLYAVGKILYNINNKVTIQQKSFIEVIKRKKLKKEGSRKKQIKETIIKKPVLVYTGELNSEANSKNMVIIKEWKSNGSWKTDEHSDKKEWIPKKSVTKKRGNLDIISGFKS